MHNLAQIARMFLSRLVKHELAKEIHNKKSLREKRRSCTERTRGGAPFNRSGKTCQICLATNIMSCVNSDIRHVKDLLSAKVYSNKSKSDSLSAPTTTPSATAPASEHTVFTYNSTLLQKRKRDYVKDMNDRGHFKST